MRLTLRTLLAYLDDTLEVGEIKTIGQKVSESEAAQELVARLKQVTRRRRLTVPPATGPNGFDPNDVAEYLDNELDTEKVAELEKQCLESDVHLAEIAACHQILALVLGEPALVPPTAKERMYGLVQGREAIPSRRAPVRKTTGDALDEEESLSVGSRLLPWALPVAGLLLIVALALAVYQVLPDRGRDDRRSASNTDKSGNGQATDKDKGKGDDKPGQGKPGGNGKGDKPGKPGGNGSTGGTAKGKDKGKEEETPEVPRIPPPRNDGKTIGKYVGATSGLTSLLVRQAGDKPGERVAKDGAVATGETLVSLPGFVSEVQTHRGVKVVLRGSMRELALAPPMANLLDSAVILHANDQFDLDLTLLRGRIFIRNDNARKGCKVRVRLDEETWDLTLPEVGDQVGIDLTHVYKPYLDPMKDLPERDAYLAVLRGKVQLTLNAFTNLTLDITPPKFALLHYNSHTRTRPPMYFDQVPLSWAEEVPDLEKLPAELREQLKPWAAEAKAIGEAVTKLGILATGKKTAAELANAALSLRNDEKATPQARKVALYALGGLDDLRKLVDALNDSSRQRALDRETAFFVLRSWAYRAPRQGTALYDPEASTGVLLDLNFKPGEAKAIRDMLFPFRQSQLGRVETYEYLVLRLQSSKVAIAEMAIHHLAWISPPKTLPGGFNAADGYDERKAYAGLIQGLIDKKILPPAPPKEEKK